MNLQYGGVPLHDMDGHLMQLVYNARPNGGTGFFSWQQPFFPEEFLVLLGFFLGGQCGPSKCREVMIIHGHFARRSCVFSNFRWCMYYVSTSDVHYGHPRLCIPDVM